MHLQAQGAMVPAVQTVQQLFAHCENAELRHAVAAALVAQPLVAPPAQNPLEKLSHGSLQAAVQSTVATVGWPLDSRTSRMQAAIEAIFNVVEAPEAMDDMVAQLVATGQMSEIEQEKMASSGAVVVR